MILPSHLRNMKTLNSLRVDNNPINMEINLQKKILIT